MNDTAPPVRPAPARLVQPGSAGVLAAAVGFVSSFTILLAGFAAVGASVAEAASGLFAVTLATAFLTIAFSVRLRMPLLIAWSTPGAVLLIATGPTAGGYAAATGAYMVAAALILAAGLWRPFGRAVAAIPTPLASAMLAGILLDLCLAPIRAMDALPWLTLPIVVAWVLALRFARLYAVPVAVLVTAIVVAIATEVPPLTPGGLLPPLVAIVPTFTFDAAVSIGVPLFIVTMASQNIPGLAVLRANGYRPDVGPIFATTGLASFATAVFGGHSINFAAITAALAAGPEADPDPSRRWIAAVAAGATYLLLAFGAGYAAAFIAKSPPLIIQAVAGLALLPALGSAFFAAAAKEVDRLPAVVTFVVTASGVAFLGIGSAFWGLAAGGALMAAVRLGPGGVR